MVADLGIAYGASDAFIEIVLEEVRLERRSRLAGDDEESLCEIDARFEGVNLRRIGRVEHQQLRMPFEAPEGPRQYVGTQARTAHTEDDGVREAPPHSFAECQERARLVMLLVRDVQPVKPPVL